MSEPVVIRVDLDCVTGEKLTFQRSETPGALVRVTLNGQHVDVQPQSLLLAAQALNLNEKDEA